MHRTIEAILADQTLTQEQAAFAKLVAGHDLTYDFSDDFRVWQKGQEVYDKIKAESKKFDRAFVVEVWNASVDRKIVPSSRETFYWEA